MEAKSVAGSAVAAKSGPESEMFTERELKTVEPSMPDEYSQGSSKEKSSSPVGLFGDESMQVMFLEYNFREEMSWELRGRSTALGAFS